MPFASRYTIRGFPKHTKLEILAKAFPCENEKLSTTQEVSSEIWSNNFWISVQHFTYSGILICGSWEDIKLTTWRHERSHNAPTDVLDLADLARTDNARLCTVPDPGFSGGGSNSQGQCTNLLFSNIFGETVWKWKNLERDGGANPWHPPLDPPLVKILKPSDLQAMPHSLSRQSVELRTQRLLGSNTLEVTFSVAGNFSYHLGNPLMSIS